MSAQNDFQAGFDLSSVNPATQTQVMAAIENLAPLSNIGLIVIQATTPDVVGNVRFKQYFWLDSSTDPYTVKVYSPAAVAWIVLPVSANSVIAASIADYAVTYNTKIGGFVIGDATKILRVNPAGTKVEIVPFSTLIAGGAIPLSSLSSSGSNVDYFLKINAAGVLVYEAFSGTLLAANSIPLAKLVNGTAGFILRNNAGGVVESVSNDDAVSNFLITGTSVKGISLAKLSGVGAADLGYARYDGVNHTWVSRVPTYLSVSTGVPIANGNYQIAHGLGTALTPRKFGAYFVCVADDVATGWVAGDIIDANCIVSAAAFNKSCTPYANATYVGVAIRLSGGAPLRFPQKAGAGDPVVPTAVNRFDLYVWAEL